MDDIKENPIRQEAEVPIQPQLMGAEPNPPPGNEAAFVMKSYADNVYDYIKNQIKYDVISFITQAYIKTGFPNLDDIIGYLYPGFYVLGAASSVGKTTFLLQMAYQIILNLDSVLYISLEQSKLELVSKILSRITAVQCRMNISMAETAIDIRSGNLFNSVTLDACAELLKNANLLTIIEGDFSVDMAKIESIVDDYVATTGRVPVVMLDYLQIVQGKGFATDKGRIDHITKSLKILQRKYDAVVIAISSINRANYRLPLDFESFKESGSIEYSADSVWGLELQIVTDQAFMNLKNVAQKRQQIAAAKAAIPRKVKLTCLKNRYGIASFECGFLYYPQFDWFLPDPSYKVPVQPAMPRTI